MSTPHYYLKIMIKPSGRMGRLRFGDTPEELAGWQGERRPAEEKTSAVGTANAAPAPLGKVDPEVAPNPFEVLSNDLTAMNDAFFSTMRIVLRSLPDMMDDGLDEKFSEIIGKYGVLVSEDPTSKVYAISGDCINDVVELTGFTQRAAKGFSELPGMFLMGLVSSFDVYFSNLQKCILQLRPEIISNTDKTVTLKDLIETGSVESVRDRIIDREIDDTMRGSHADQVAWIESKLKINLRKNPAWHFYVELFERRNLLTHTGGIVSCHYMRVCQQHGYDTSKINVGDKLRITPRYLRHAVDILLEFGIGILQVVWRHLRPAEVDRAAQKLDRIGYELIKNRRYKLASRLLKFGVEAKAKGSDATQKRLTINYANAIKLSGKKEDALKILDEVDWSAVTENYHICMAAIREDIDRVVELMKALDVSGAITKQCYRDWPVFEPLRTMPEFQRTFRDLYDEDLFKDAASSLEEGSEEAAGVEAGTGTADDEIESR